MEKYFKTRKAWRKWLEKNHDANDGLWLVFFKKKSGKTCIRYEDAVEEALCFGWIDSKLKSVNEEYYIQNFTPRRKGSNWSKLNLSRAEKLQKAGLMDSSGLAEYNKALENPLLSSEMHTEEVPEIPEDLNSALGQNSAAFENFINFPPSARRLYILWLNTAKRSETRLKRIARIVENSSMNIKPGMM